MRRQARISIGGALIGRSASALQVWLWLLIFIFQNEFRISRSIQPGYLDFDNLPETNFTCAGKVIGGYYADLETSCQMFHVCTVGAADEPMDIKFLCLNGTVFDQETRVCERVDEVDCTKSEKFYSLNLELYGSTAPPIIQPDQHKPQATEQSQHQTKPSNEPHTNTPTNPPTTTSQNKPQEYSSPADSTEDPVQEIKKDEHKKQYSSSTHPPIQVPENEELTEEYQEEDDIDYEDYSQPPTTTPGPATTTLSTTVTTKSTTTTTNIPSSSSRLPSPIPQHISSPSPLLSSLSPPVPSLPPSVPPSQSYPTLDPALLSPQEFIYRHRGPGAEAISFQSFRPADGVYITHSPPQQYDHFQYESSRTAPRPTQQRPTPFVQRQPTPFRPTTLDPRDQLLRPGPTSQPSERHETSVKHRQQNYPASTLPSQRPLPFNYYYDRKRSDDSAPENESSLSARSVAPPTDTERPPPKPKSPPRVIVTASASVSDSNGKRLNYTVGNVVSAVKPIVPINYDDYKESDLIFDPFFLDVPKLQKRRKTRSNRNIIIIPVTANAVTDSKHHESVATSTPVTSKTRVANKIITKKSSTTTTPAWNPDDYVDDNYEPHAYVPPVPPLAILAHDHNKYVKERLSVNKHFSEKNVRGISSKIDRSNNIKPMSVGTASMSSSQTEAGDTAPPPSVAPPLPPPVEASACAPSRSSDCRTRA